MSDADRLAALERRIARQEDHAAIERVMALYAKACDTDYDDALFCSLFTEDGVWESNAFGVYRGRAEIEGFMLNADWGAIRFVHHSMITQWIDIADDGSTATGRWYLVEFASRPAPDRSEKAVIIAGVYTDRLVKLDGEWKIAHCQADFAFNSDWDKGWVKQQFRD